MTPAVRLALALAAAANLVLALAFAFQVPWALALWPLSTGRLSYIFVGSILAAIAAGAAWVAVSGETGSLPAGFLDLTVTLGGVSAYLFVAGTRPLLPPAAGAGVLAGVSLVLFWRTRRPHATAGAPLPGLVRASYVAFSGILLAVGLALVLRIPGVMPWPLDPGNSVLIGCIFLGNACYFGYAVLRPRWDAARAQLWSFLAYDVILLGPLLAHYPAAPPDLRTNVVVYAAVLIYSGALAVYYLLLNRATRGWGHEHGERPYPATAK